LLKRMPGGGKLIGLIVVAGALLAPNAAQATINSALGVPCTVQGDGVRFCTDTPRSTVPSPVDGVPIDVNIAFPPEPASGPDGNYPLVMMFHGYGGDKMGLGAMQHWLDRGYATFSMTDRGFHESCGSPASRTAAGTACDAGYVRLIDNRYEVRDAQDFAGLLADENLIDGQKIGSIGGSYGGGMSMALGTLKNRVVDLDYSLHPWTSPMGKPMQIAAAAPNIPWTDLAYSLAPNGSTLDYVADAPYAGRLGVEKASFVTGLYGSGLAAPGFYATPGTDDTADLTGWRTRLMAGEPYGDDVKAIVDELTQHHSSYYLDHSIAPAPMLMSSGFTDDLFPADETIRYYNRTKTQYPDADVALFFGDFGHQRGSNKDDVVNALAAREDAWFDYFIKGEGSKPPEGVEAYTQTCPKAAPSGGPYAASNWATIAPGEIRLSDGGTQTIAADSTTNGAFNPVTNGNACATTSSDDTPGAAVYKMDAAPEGGYTMMGAATVIADFTLGGETSQVAARLLDVGPDGTETLVDRGLWRPANGGPARQVFQLHPNGWHFDAGHVPKLELIAADGVNPDPVGLLSYGRPSNGQEPVTVSDLELRIPVVEKPGALDGLVKAPAEKFLPSGYELAKDFADLDHPTAKLKGKKLKVKGRKATAKIACPDAFAACNDGKVVVTAKIKKPKKHGHGASKPAKAKVVARGKFDGVAGGHTAKVKLKLTKKAAKSLKRKPKLKAKVEVSSAETDRTATSKATLKGKKKHHKGGKGGK
jgi:predicted acyl esterase